jgi:hypothetical protein
MTATPKRPAAISERPRHPFSLEEILAAKLRQRKSRPKTQYDNDNANRPYNTTSATIWLHQH